MKFLSNLLRALGLISSVSEAVKPVVKSAQVKDLPGVIDGSALATAKILEATSMARINPQSK